MKILQVSTAFKPSWERGGITRAVYEISCELNKNHEVTVYTTDQGGKRVETLKNKQVIVDGLIVYYFSNLSNWFAMKLNIVTPYYLAFIARKKIKEYDIIHIHEFRTFEAAIVQYYARTHNIPYIIQAHGTTANFSQKGLFKKFFDYLVGNNILKSSSKAIALTNIEKQQYMAMNVPTNKIEIVPNGIRLEDYSQSVEKNKFRKKYSIKNNAKIILYLGRLDETKGIELIINSFSKILTLYPEAKLVIAGPDDGYYSQLESLVESLQLKEDVYFTGPLYGEEKDEVYVDSDVFVTPNYTGFPLTFLEACAYGIPIVTTKKGHELDWLDGKVGLSVEYHEGDLKEAILKIIIDEELSSTFSNNGKTLVKEEFNWTNITHQLVKIYEDSVDKN